MCIRDRPRSAKITVWALGILRMGSLLLTYVCLLYTSYTENYTDYLDTIPHLFHYNAIVMLSNGGEAKVGTLGSKYEFCLLYTSCSVL